MDQELLNILVCPETKQPLKLAGADVIRELNEKISAGEVSNVGGEKIETQLEMGLIREDGKLLYPIEKDIPLLLVERGINID